VSNAPSNPCTANSREDYYLDCSGCNGGQTNCVPTNSCSGFCSGNTWSARCCNPISGQCNDASIQADASLLKVE
jgi:hypothetical protein